VIRATGEGAVRLPQEPEKPVSLRQLILLHGDNEILAWLLANPGQDPLDLLVVESGCKNRVDRAQTAEPARGDTRFSIPTFEKMPWGSFKRMRIRMTLRMRMRRRRRRNGERPRARGNCRGLLMGRGLFCTT